MGKLSTYDIAYKGLKEGLHEFNYRLDAGFFKLFEGGLVGNANVDATVLFEKRSTLLTLMFKIKGTVELTCDRCLEDYQHPIRHKAKVIVKFGEGNGDTGDDFFWVSPEEHYINVAQLLYEYTVLSIPIKHVHPEENGDNACNPEMLKKIKSYSNAGQEGKTDERWEALKNLMNNN